MLLRFGRLHGLVIIALGAFFLVFGFDETVRDVRLDRSGLLLKANVDDTRILRDKWGVKSYEVRYSFALPNDPATYSRTDSTGRRGLWSALPQDVWNEATRLKQVDVVYLAANPWINCPTAGSGTSPWEHAGVVVLGLFAMGFGAWLLVMLWWTGKKHWEP